MAVEAGLLPHQYKRMSLYEIGLVITGYQKRVRVQWEIARETWLYIIRYGNVDPKTAPKRVQDVRPFPWDEPINEEETDTLMLAALNMQKDRAEKQRQELLLNENSNGQ